MKREARNVKRPSRRAVVIGLTGAIGTGKSNVLQTLVSLGADGIDADRVAHLVMEPGGPAYAAILGAFGPDVFGADGRVDRQRLSARVLGEGGALARLEGIVHPAVVEVLQAQAAAAKAPAVAIEAIKLLEAGLDRTLCDEVWVTTCSRSQQFTRLASSRGMQPEQVRKWLAVQMPVRQMMARADRVIDTGGTIAETRLAVLGAWADLGLRFPEPRARPAGLDDVDGIAAILNAVVGEGGLSTINRTFTLAQERALIRRLPERARLTVADVGKVIVGFQVIKPYAACTGTMDHVAALGTYVSATMRNTELGRRMSEETFKQARAAGYEKVVVQVRADNAGANDFYAALGFRVCGRLARQARVTGGDVDVVLFERFLQ